MTFPAVMCSLSLQGKRDLNPQPSVLETDALPIELLPSGALTDALLCLRAITRAYENNGDWTPRQESLTEYCDESRTPAAANRLSSSAPPEKVQVMKVAACALRS
jgi:hypothetical protein